MAASCLWRWFALPRWCCWRQSGAPYLQCKSCASNQTLHNNLNDIHCDFVRDLLCSSACCSGQACNTQKACNTQTACLPRCSTRPRGSGARLRASGPTPDHRGDDRKATPANNPTSTFNATAASPANLSPPYCQHRHSFPYTRHRPAPLHAVQPDLAPHHVGR